MMMACCDCPKCPASLRGLSDCYSITIPANTTGDDVCNFLDGTHVLTRGTDPDANARLEEIYASAYPSEFRIPCNLWVSPIYDINIDIGLLTLSQVAWVLELANYQGETPVWRLWIRYNFAEIPPDEDWASTGETIGSSWRREVLTAPPYLDPPSVFKTGGGAGGTNDCPQIPATINITPIECPAESPSLMATASEPSKGCTGCTKRKETMNSILPGSGDLVEKFTEKTGLKSWWESRQAD